MTRFPLLFETLTGQPADPTAQVKAAIAEAQIKHAKRANLRSDLSKLVHRRLEAACNG